MLRINSVKYTDHSKQESEVKPSQLFSLFSDNNHRDILSLIAAYASVDDLTQVKMSNKAAFVNINKWLDQTFTNPELLLKVLGKLNKIQIANLLQKYFSHGSPYLEILEDTAFEEIDAIKKLRAADDSHAADKRPAYAYACYALVTEVDALDLKILGTTLEWMRADNLPEHLIASIELIYFLLSYGNDNGIPEPGRLDELIEARPLAYINFCGADLNREGLQDLDLRGANFQHTILNRARLDKSKLEGALLQHADMTLCNANAANFSGANLQFANLDKASFFDSNFSDSDLRFANLRFADFKRAKLNGAKMQGTTLTRAKLIDADAIKANFYKSDLTLANLCSANLTDASLDKSRLSGVNFFNADLSHAAMRGAIHKPSQMPFARYLPEDNAPEPPLKVRKR